MNLRPALLACIITTLLVTSSLPAQSKDVFLTGPQIWAKLSGKTMSGSEAGVEYSEKLLADGTIEGSSSTEPTYDGEWEVSGDEICFYYESDSEDDCSRIAINGRTVIFIDEDGLKSTASLK